MSDIRHEREGEPRRDSIIEKSLTARYDIGFEPGPGYQRGFILSEIVRYISNFKDGVEEPKIREYLFKEYKIKNLKTIKDHLEKLRLEGLIIKKEKSGRSNVWVLNYSNRDTVAEYIITEFLSKNLFIAKHIRDERNKIMDLYRTEGIQQFIRENNFSHKFYLSLVSGMLRVLPDQNKDWETVGCDIDTPDDDEFIIVDALKNGLLISPTLFIHLYYPLIEVELIFWLSINKMLLKRDDSHFILKMSYHLIFSTIMLDRIKFRDSEIFMKFIQSHHYRKEFKEYFDKLTDQITEFEQLLDKFQGIAKSKVKFIYP